MWMRSWGISASCGQVDPVFRTERCAASDKEHRIDPKSGFHFWDRCSWSCGRSSSLQGRRFRAERSADLKDRVPMRAPSSPWRSQPDPEALRPCRPRRRAKRMTAEPSRYCAKLRSIGRDPDPRRARVSPAAFRAPAIAGQEGAARLNGPPSFPSGLLGFGAALFPCRFDLRHHDGQTDVEFAEIGAADGRQ
jgi:hypothetical protein